MLARSSLPSLPSLPKPPASSAVLLPKILHGCVDVSGTRRNQFSCANPMSLRPLRLRSAIKKDPTTLRGCRRCVDVSRIRPSPRGVMEIIRSFADLVAAPPRCVSAFSSKPSTATRRSSKIWFRLRCPKASPPLRLKTPSPSCASPLLRKKKPKQPTIFYRKCSIEIGKVLTA